MPILPKKGKQVILRNATVIDGTGSIPQGGTDVRVSDGFIAEVGRDLPVDGSSELDLTGQYLLPGLIDLHVHLCWDGGSDPATVLRLQTEAEVVAQCVRAGFQNLEYGVTAVRDVGSSYDAAIVTAQAVRDHWFVGPRTYTSGRTITMTGGHDPFWASFVDSPSEAVKATREQIYKGADLIKIAATGGVYGRAVGESAGQSELTYEEIAAITTEAHRFGLKVASHAVGTEGIANSVKAGVDTIEHGILADEETLLEMKRRGTVLVPTLFIYETIAAGNAPDYATKKAAAITGRHVEVFKRALELGITIGVGSDAGSPCAPHGCLHDELASFVRLGVTNSEAIRMATSVNAQILGVPDIGTIAPGMRADMIVVGRDPTSDIANLRKVQQVLVDGRLVKPT